MAARTSLDAAALRAVMSGFADALRSHRSSINRLNVYPVPDGDTGTNMALTLESVVADLAGVDDVMPEVCRALAHGSLMGARGNSGVILSQIIRGLADAFCDAAEIDARLLARGLDAASQAAYGAVLRPVEGTILTVARAAATGAMAAAEAGGDLVAVSDAARQAAADALACTPDLLPVLRDAGVVDAGGTGFLLFCDALLHVVDGRAMPEPEVPSDDIVPVAVGERPGVADMRYEVMYFLHTTDDRVEAFKDAWMSIGDSIVVVGGDGLYNCHIHTNDIGAAIEAGIEVGRPTKIRVTDLLEEVEEQDWVREAASIPPSAVAEHVTTAVVAVGVGDGVVRLLRSLGAHEVVSGGQSMNPSTADIVEALSRVRADGVVVLPNNKNIVPVAQQAAEQLEIPVRVVPTHSVVEGLAALVAYDPEAPVDENVGAMEPAAGAVVSGAVTRAVRDATTAAGAVREGDEIGVSDDGVVAIADTVVGAATGLLAALIDDTHEIVTVISGAEATEADTAAICAWLEAEHPDLEVEVHNGGQPLYVFEFGIE